MPIWLRNFTFNKIKEYYEKQNEEINQSQKGKEKTVIGKDGKVKSPEFLSKSKTPPTYTTTTTKK